MSVLRPRTRLVNFRLSDDEFDRLRASCALHGSRSISEFARTSVLERMETNPNVAFGSQSGGTQNRMFQLDNKVNDLEHRFTQILQILQAGALAAQAPSPAARTAATGD
jgi:hypothetical protein